jgi:hypothetical protein
MTLPAKKRLFSFDSTTTTNSTDKLVVEQGTEIKISTLDKVRIWLQGLFDLRYAFPLNGTGFVKVSGTTVSYDNNTYLTANTPYYIGTTLSNLNRSSNTQNLTGVNIDGNAITAGTAGTVLDTNLGYIAIGIVSFNSPTQWSKPAGYQGFVEAGSSNSLGLPSGAAGYLAYNVIGRRNILGGYYATLTDQIGNMWFTYTENSSNWPTWTKVQTSNSIASQATVNSGTNNTDTVTPLTLQKRNVDTSATYSSGTTSVTTSTVNGLITFTSVPTLGNSTTYTITNSYFTSIPQAQAAIIDFSIKYLSSPTNDGLIIAGYFINSSGVISVRVYNIGITNPASFQLYYNIIG